MPASVQETSTGQTRRTPNASTSSSGRQQNASEQRDRKADFLCRVRYSNTLPDIPFETKFLESPFIGLHRFIAYKPTSLEKNYKYELLTEPDLGVKIDLINPETYQVDLSAPMDKTDEKLIEEEPVGQQNTKRSLQHSKIVPWMRKTEYISSEFNRLGTSSDRQETKVGYMAKKKFENENIYRDRASQIETINKTFDEASKSTTKHYSKPGVVAIQEMELLPDFEVIFDSDPAPLDAKAKSQEMMSQALIRGMMDESGEQFVAYFVPTEETLEKRREDAEKSRPFDPAAEYDYQMTREYNWTVKNKASKGYEQENYFVVLRGDGAFYNELETRIPNSRLIVRNRDEQDTELAQQRQRVHSLMYPHEEEEEETQEENTGDNPKDQEMKEEEHDGDSDNNPEKAKHSSSTQAVDGEEESDEEDSDIEVRADSMVRHGDDDDDSDEDSEEEEDD